jgi:aspartate dehydrogenase
MPRVGIVGVGAIGSYLASSILKGELKGWELSGLYDKNREKINSFLEKFPDYKKVAKFDKEEFIQDIDFLVEAASVEAIKEWVEPCLMRRKPTLVLSVGGILKYPEVIRIAYLNSTSIYIPSGAICGIDGIMAAGKSKIHYVKLTSRKPVPAWSSAPYLKEQNIKLDNITSPIVLFKGDPYSAIAAFPQNTNIIATIKLALSYSSIENTGVLELKEEKEIQPHFIVELIADPTITHNIHRLELEGDVGKLEIECRNLPSQFNPKTSLLAALSAKATLHQIYSYLRLY